LRFPDAMTSYAQVLSVVVNGGRPKTHFRCLETSDKQFEKPYIEGLIRCKEIRGRLSNLWLRGGDATRIIQHSVIGGVSLEEGMPLRKIKTTFHSFGSMSFEYIIPLRRLVGCRPSILMKFAITESRII
jgi:hypothetical protein